MAKNASKYTWPWLLVTAVILAAFGWWHSHRKGVPVEERSAPSASNLPRAFATNPPTTDRLRETSDPIDAALAALREGDGEQAMRQSLEALRKELAALPRERAAGMVLAHLNSGVNAMSRLEFKVGSGGALVEAPSLRVFLLDYLAQLDPRAAAAYARTILATKASADEWAIALRNLARAPGDNGDLVLLEQKTRELLAHEPWQREASVGFLEAFDVAVHLGGAKLVPELTALVRQLDNPGVAHAAYLALDRLTIAQPAAILEKLVNEPGLMSGREASRANFFARADARDGAQRTVLEHYLLDPQLTAEELKTFAGLYPNANFMVSQNLLTPVITPDRTALTAHDRAALQVVNEWLADERFTLRRPHLEQIRARLETFVRQADAK